MDPPSDMSGKLVLVTGGSSGIGRAAALNFAERGATVAIIARSPERGRAAREAIASRVGHDHVELLMCDFARLSCVREAADEFLDAHDALDVLVNDAGLIVGERVLTDDGNELTFQVCHLAHFLLTNLLLDMLLAAPAARIISVSSDAHFSARGIRFNDLTQSRGYGPYRVYAESKLANVMFTYSLASRLAGGSVAVNAMHPGSVRTEWGRDWRGIAGIGWNLVRPFLLSPERGADTLVYLASSPEAADVSSGYFSRRRPKLSSAASYDRQAQERLWQVSEELTGLAVSGASLEAASGLSAL